MDIEELQAMLRRGEDTKLQFKKNVTNAESLAGEMGAFANTLGGILIIGVDDDGNAIGLSKNDIKRLNQLIANTATNNIKNPINPITENVLYEDKLLLIVHIANGLDKPYLDNKGVVWVKSGSDKRRVTSKEELRRLFQQSDLLHADEVPVRGSSDKDIDLRVLKPFYEKEFEVDWEELTIPLIQLLTNLNLAKNGNLTLGGLLLFGKNPKLLKPSFIIKAVHFVGNEVTGKTYRESLDIKGNLKRQYADAMSFLKRNLRYLQNGQSINSLGELEVPHIVLEELLTNALIHRDYFINAPIRLFLFDNRIEIISPGILPNNLNIENIKNGNSNIRNDTIASFATRQMPYRGIGTGIRRSIKYYPNIDFINDIDGQQFIVIIHRTKDAIH